MKLGLLGQISKNGRNEIMTDHISTRIDNGILSVQFKRPEKKNALTGAMYLSIAEGISRAERDQAAAIAATESA
jgi:enoyl-CoA hydratase/carnithine racemase